jgi:hypothetical protein
MTRNRTLLLILLRPGRKLHIEWLWLGLMFALALPAAAEDEAEFIFPGIEFSRLDARVGAWCRYRVVDTALDIDDTTIVYIAVSGRRSGPGIGAFWLEIENSPLRALESDRLIYKLLISDAVKTAAAQDSLVHFILGLYIKKGTEPTRSEDPSSLRNFPLGPPTTDSLWTVTPEVKIAIPAGEFSCLKKERSIHDEKIIPAGRIRLHEKRDDAWTVWLCDEVPIFHLAGGLIERSKETETIPPIKEIPAAGRKQSRTEAELIGFGFQAEPILDLNTDR